MIPAVDVVGVFDSQFRQVFPTARTLKAIVKESAQVMAHPVESGSTIVDHRIILPIEIELSLIMKPDSYVDAYNQVRKSFLNAELLTVQTKTARYSNMLIDAMPHDEDPATFDTITMGLSLREVKIARAKTGVIPLGTSKNANNSSTENAGQKQPKSAAADLLSRAGVSLSSFF